MHRGYCRPIAAHERYVIMSTGRISRVVAKHTHAVTSSVKAAVVKAGCTRWYN